MPFGSGGHTCTTCMVRMKSLVYEWTVVYVQVPRNTHATSGQGNVSKVQDCHFGFHHCSIGSPCFAPIDHSSLSK